MRVCPVCHEMVWATFMVGDGHQCAPEWEVCRYATSEPDDDEDEHETIRASSADRAAAEAVETAFDGSWDPTFPEDVYVRPAGGEGPWQKFEVKGELCVDWRASAVRGG